MMGQVPGANSLLTLAPHVALVGASQSQEHMRPSVRLPYQVALIPVVYPAGQLASADGTRTQTGTPLGGTGAQTCDAELQVADVRGAAQNCSLLVQDVGGGVVVPAEVQRELT